MLELALYFTLFFLTLFSLGIAVCSLIEVKALKNSTHRVIMPTAMTTPETSPRAAQMDKAISDLSGANMFMDEDELQI